VKPLRLAIVSISLGIAVVLVVTAWALWPRPVSCGSGGGSMGNGSVGTNMSAAAENGTFSTLQLPDRADVTFSWSTPDGSAATFLVKRLPSDLLYSSTGTSGSGSFVTTSSGTDYAFGIGLTPANAVVGYEYSCSVYR
jgi:hypothetical protein